MEAALDIYPPYQGAVRETYLKELHWVSGYLASKGSPIPASSRAWSRTSPRCAKPC